MRNLPATDNLDVNRVSVPLYPVIEILELIVLS